MKPAYMERQRFEAAQWFMDIHEADAPSADLLLNWSRWLEASDGNRLAFEAVERAWHDAPTDIHPSEFDSVKAQRPYDADIPVTEWLNQRNRRSLRPLFTVLAAASLVLVIAGGWLMRSTPERYSTGRFVTGTGEHMEVALTDGSRVSLGARTRLVVDFTSTERRLRLEAGEAFFDVSKDPNRPFNVHALEGVITAVGTAFNVRATEDRVMVAVTEGLVSVHGSTAATAMDEVPQAIPQGTRLRSGEQLTFTQRASSPSIDNVVLTHFDSEQATRWREGWLVYRNEPLRYVISDVARYTDRHVAVSGSVNPELKFTGAVYRGSVVEWLEALPGVFPVSVRADGREVIVATP